ncbi:hypothetical protein ACFOY5_21000 [Massilia aurea]|uniref:hypothetical protein n=1 Tax=Massilia aurea TaxID=373040 RepID=UPI0021628048|nr:hypothetical protein [Massilia aurea]MCS0709975.1 hypothetical protein [Massilia aurea]
MNSDDIDELRQMRICYVCVDEAYLSKEIQNDGDPVQCSYCNEIVNTYSIGDVAECIETAFEQHFYLTNPNPDDVQQMLMADRESRYEFYRDGLATADAIENAGGFPSDAARVIQEILAEKHSSRESDEMGEETPFSPEAHYSEVDTNTRAWREVWRQFEQSLRTEGRFFNRAAAAHLTAIFGGIDKLRTTEDDSLVVEVGPGCKIDHFYRGRVFQTEAPLLEALCRPDRHLGSPPANFAAAGRMNAHLFTTDGERHDTHPSDIVIARALTATPDALLLFNYSNGTYERWANRPAERGYPFETRAGKKEEGISIRLEMGPGGSVREVS